MTDAMDPTIRPDAVETAEGPLPGGRRNDAETPGPRPDGVPPFRGAKIGLLADGDLVLTILRDPTWDLFPNCWELPGGGRDGDETPWETIAREVQEELGVTLDPAQIDYVVTYPSHRFPGVTEYFFGGTISAIQVAAIRFGNEGQRYCLMPVHEFLELSADGIPHLQEQLRRYLTAPPQLLAESARVVLDGLVVRATGGSNE